MKQRLNYISASPEGFKALLGLEAFVSANVPHALLHLVKLRASQLNGCAYCIDMHWKDARADGETEIRLYMLDAWRETPVNSGSAGGGGTSSANQFYTEAERAALAWTEALTLVSETHAPDADFDALRPHFTDPEIANLTFAIATINAWNRLAIGFRSVPGVYKGKGK